MDTDHNNSKATTKKAGMLSHLNTLYTGIFKLRDIPAINILFVLNFFDVVFAVMNTT